MGARVLAVACLIVASLVAAASAQFPLGGSPNRPIRLEGYWERTRAAPDVIGEITIAGTGRAPRRFGVTAVQAYQPEEEGMQIFRFTSDHPATLLARGDAADRLFAAAKDRKLMAFGTYMRGSGLFVVGSVELVPPPDARRPGASPRGRTDVAPDLPAVASIHYDPGDCRRRVVARISSGSPRDRVARAADALACPAGGGASGGDEGVECRRCDGRRLGHPTG